MDDARLRRDVSALGMILSIWGHPDDETYLAAGVMAIARDLGQRVVCLTASAGEHGTPDPRRWPPTRLERVRRWEAAGALAVLGVDEHQILGFPDGDLARHDDDGAALVESVIADLAPDTILTFGPDGMTFHPDHIAVHRWVTQAWDRLGRPCRLLYAAQTTQHLTRFDEAYARLDISMSDDRLVGVAHDEAALHLCLDGPLLDRKVTALRAMASQTTDVITAIGLETYREFVAEESFVDADAHRAHDRRDRSRRTEADR